MFGSGTLNHGKMLLVTKLELDLGLIKKKINAYFRPG